MNYKHLEKGAKKAIDCAKKNKCIVLMMVDGFISDNEALILRDLLWYARNNNVEVTFVVKP